jgi:hypothetical protein
MATRKKIKKKAKKTAKKKAATRKKAVKKARRAVARPKAKPKKKAMRAKARPAPVRPAAKPAAAPKPAAPVSANEELIGAVTHYFNHLNVAIIKLETGMLREGETIHIKGHTSDFRQTVGSMEVNHVHVSTVRAGESFGLKVNDHAREHDAVYRVKGV